ncbi:MSHA biogenesis protein MshI [Marinimicrobium sp. ABcell2]|uniref:MSHA biogenesis protein MshI n=1 Tax=Marinimicrobium sp. ABcell2 TaxID=3069751 RepID=UPI0027B2BA23|nr:MSHA biogenesis protein MshI [Marinimicrobium sp. ABcell2]MDQ2075219.1 MSHA biogenesis protein MshI [Marinimicrobium sp. ABcell2]
MQQINLYLPEFRPNRKPVRAVHMGWALLAAAVLLVLISLWSSYRTGGLANQVAQEEQKLNELQGQVATLQQQQPRLRGPGLETEVERLQQEIRRRERIKALIAQQNMGNAEGFSGQLQGLARQSMEDLALEWFSLQQGGGYVELGGRVRTADLVPLYLQRLRQEDSFAGARFGVLDMGRDESTAPGLEFNLTRAKGEGSRR